GRDDEPAPGGEGGAEALLDLADLLDHVAVGDADEAGLADAGEGRDEALPPDEGAGEQRPDDLGGGAQGGGGGGGPHRVAGGARRSGPTASPGRPSSSIASPSRRKMSDAAAPSWAYCTARRITSSPCSCSPSFTHAVPRMPRPLAMSARASGVSICPSGVRR